MAKKKSAAKKVSTMSSAPAKSASCKCANGDMWLCKIALLAFIFFVMSIVKPIGYWIVNFYWWVWLVIAIIVGWKPMMSAMKK